MAEHSTENLIHSISLPSGTYEIHDLKAVHTLADLAAIGMKTEGLFSFKGTVATKTSLPKTAENGDVYHVIDTKTEYVWAKTGKTDNGVEIFEWQEFGEHFVVNHKHSVSIGGTNKSSTVSGSATITGSNAKSTVSGTASIPNVPTVTETAKYAKVSTGNKAFVTSYTGATSKLNLTDVVTAGTAANVIATVTPTTGTITGVSGSTTASKATEGTALSASKIVTEDKTATNTVYTNKTNGMLFGGVEDGVLTINIEALSQITGNSSVTAKSVKTNTDVSIPQYSFSNVTVPKAASAASTFVTGVPTTTVDVATIGETIEVATGKVSSKGGGATIMTGLGTKNTDNALISAELVAGTSTDGIHTGDDVTITTQTLSGTISGEAAAQVWTQNTGTISGTAAAQAWSQNPTSAYTSGTYEI